jgi:hypothetical protein
MKTFKARLIGDSPFIMHSCAGLDAFNPLRREIKKLTDKKKKTDDDLLEIKRIEWHMGLYLDEKDEPCVPADMILANLIQGARKAKLGKQAQAAVFEARPFFRLEYEGPRVPGELYKNPRFVDYRPVRNQQNRVMRSRPIFRSWAVAIELMFDESIFDPDSLHQAVAVGGEQIGIGDYRPRFGRFHIDK